MNPTPSPDLPPGIPPGISASDLAAAARRRDLAAQAAATPFPGPLLAAFSPPSRSICGLKLLPVVASHLLFLQQIESPLLAVANITARFQDDPAARDHAIAELVAPRPSESDAQAAARLAQQTFESLFIFITPPDQVRDLLRKGRSIFTEAALTATADRLPVTALPDVQRIIAEHLGAAFATAVEYAAPPAPDGSFTSAPAETPTASAGASTSSPPC